jgi:hypothetical protein
MSERTGPPKAIRAIMWSAVRQAQGNYSFTPKCEQDLSTLIEGGIEKLTSSASSRPSDSKIEEAAEKLRQIVRSMKGFQVASAQGWKVLQETDLAKAIDELTRKRVSLRPFL